MKASAQTQAFFTDSREKKKNPTINVYFAFELVEESIGLLLIPELKYLIHVHFIFI